MQKRHPETKTATKRMALESRFAAAETPPAHHKDTRMNEQQDINMHAGSGANLPAKLVYDGTLIRDRKETLSLTDMWKAGGSDESRKPSEWLSQEAAKRFIEFLAESLGIPEAGDSRFGLVTVKKGGTSRGETWGHWQIAMAYAKYLDPKFHVWCNSVVREKMEGRPASSSVAVTKLDESVKAVIGNMIKQCTGVVLRDEIGPIIARAVQDAQRREDMHPTVDLTSTITAADVLDMAQPKGRFRGTTQFITREMLKLTKKEGCWRTPPHVNRSQPWRFPREKAQEWLFGASLGAEMIHSYVAQRAERKAKAALPVDQKVIQFRAPSTNFEGGAA